MVWMAASIPVLATKLRKGPPPDLWPDRVDLLGCLEILFEPGGRE